MENDESVAFEETMRELDAMPEIQQLKQFSHHRNTTTYAHCRNVAYHALRIAQKMHMKVDGKTLAKGIMLHDYYLYDTASMDYTAYQHGTKHPAFALQNAQKDFELSEKEQGMIRSHMWPLTLMHCPASKEAWLLCLADKICAIEEFAGKV